ncbi:plasmid partitioning protein RepB C-terminal domain-containing protein [uncultured Methylobacterium sp.]|uniref:plasmid partitioning protein RepB C-terminal domain-containing protein n=1 Tax=uncultured Methylobacterium sp. TaxID=157278 RepID=UPI0035C952DE
MQGADLNPCGRSGMDPEESANEKEARGQTRAVAYVRMSTDPQQFSIENQLAEIWRYADLRGFEVVRVYEDAGRSGLTLGGREGLTRLMADVASGSADFQAILAYDISRWGRFQDADEGAHYEFLCSRAGIQVHYCAEQFDNDGTTSSVLLKAVKRVMAREHSRELSVKVFAGQCRLVEKGFRQGGMAGFGLRRLLVDEGGIPKGELSLGQRKSLQTDRVILVPGPDGEVDTVRRMYRMFVEDGRGEAEIAAALNLEGVRTDLGHRWTRGTVHEVLTNEKYVGNNRLSAVQERAMIVRAMERGVQADKIAAALCIRPESVQRKVRMLDGICDEAVSLLKDKQCPMAVFEILQKMKPLRQIEAAELLVGANNYTVNYASAILAMTPQSGLVDGGVRKKVKGVTPEALARMERELAKLQESVTSIQETYGRDTLELTVVRGYLSKLLRNGRIVRYLVQNRPEFLDEFQAITESKSTLLVEAAA